MTRDELLRQLGLSAYEAAVYGALLGLDRAKVQELSRIVAVPRSQIYVALNSLMNKGMVVETRGNVSYYSAVAPAIAFRSVLRREELALRARAEGVARLNKEHERIKKTEVPPHFVQVLRGRQIRNFIDDLAGRADHEVLIFLKSAASQTPKSIEGAARSEIALLERGVRVRCIYETSISADPAIIPVLRRLQAAGEEARVIESLPMNMMVFDTRAALFSLAEAGGGLVVFAFAHPGLVTLMKQSFEFTWDRASTLNTRLPRPKRRPTARPRRSQS